MRQSFIPIVLMGKLRFKKAKSVLLKVVCLVSGGAEECRPGCLVTEAPALSRCEGPWLVSAPLTLSGPPVPERLLGVVESITTSLYNFSNSPLGSCSPPSAVPPSAPCAALRPKSKRREAYTWAHFCNCKNALWKHTAACQEHGLWC